VMNFKWGREGYIATAIFGPSSTITASAISESRSDFPTVSQTLLVAPDGSSDPFAVRQLTVPIRRFESIASVWRTPTTSAIQPTATKTLHRGKRRERPTADITTAVRLNEIGRHAGEFGAVVRSSASCWMG
jgi:hypothetical protein